VTGYKNIKLGQKHQTFERNEQKFNDIIINIANFNSLFIKNIHILQNICYNLFIV